jgi:hypothetical protein
MGKVKKGQTVKPKSQINSNVEKLREPCLSFSFEHFQPRHSKFSYSACQHAYFDTLMSKLIEFSKWTVKRFTTPTHETKRLRVHPHDWGKHPKLTEDTYGTGPGGNSNFEHDNASYQFNLTVNEHGRVHGFLVGGVFYIVWLDPNHLLYSE